MNIVIAHLYYDILNLYGEIGNIDVLEYHLKDKKIKYTIKKLSLEDKLNFDEYDLVYIGSGTENNQLLALDHIIKYKDDIKRNIENNKLFLITGNSIELFGEEIESTKALNIFNYKAIRNTKRIVTETTLNTPLINKNILGFQNQQCNITGDYGDMEVIKGINKKEGKIYKNFFGTYLLGPILVRNPELLKHIFYKLTKIKNLNLTLDEKAYNEYINFKENVK